MISQTLSLLHPAPVGQESPLPAKGASLAEQTYDFLKDNIIYLRYEPGSPLRENQLAKQLGISRSPMREALARLEREGFIEIVPWRGARVREITLKYATDLFQVRVCLEGMAARLAVPRIDRRELEAFLASMDALSPRIEAGDVPAFYAHEVVFHDLFISNCGNELLQRSMTGIRDHVSRIRNYLSSKSIPGGHELLSFREHRMVMHAFLTGSGEAAEAAVRRHLESVLARMVDYGVLTCQDSFGPTFCQDPEPSSYCYAGLSCLPLSDSISP